MPNDVAQNLRAFLLADTTIAGLVSSRVHQNDVPQESDPPYVWYQLAGVEYEGVTDAEPGTPPDTYLYDLEAVAGDVGAAANLGLLIRNLLAFHRGEFGDSTVQAVFVDDHQDDYIPRNDDADAGLHAATMRISVSP